MPRLSIEIRPLSYESRLESRELSAIDLVVMHCTELPDMAMAREFGERIRHEASQTGNSGHFYVDRNGAVSQYVAANRVAHHCAGYNVRSIGIELCNRGRYPDWSDSRRQAFNEEYTAEQIVVLGALLHDLCDTVPTLKWIAGHEDLDRRLEPASDDPSILLPRRRDPGPLFPWADVMADMTLQRLRPSPEDAPA